MRKTKEQKNKLSRSVVLSIIFHVLLFGFIIFGSLDEIIKLGGGGQGGEVVDAIMVDPGVVIEQYNQLQRQQNSAKQADTERKKRLQQQEEELRKQQEEEQKRLKMVAEVRIKIAREAEQQRKQAEEPAAKAKAEQERLIKEQAEAKAKAEAQAKKEAEIARAKAQAEAKEKAAKALAAKKKADAAKQAATVDSLLGGLTAQQPTQQMGGAAAAGQGGNRKSGASSSDVANYAGKIKAAIESKFYDADIYRGKTCELSIKLAPDGMLISIAAKSNTANDQPLCDAAIRAAKTATMPKPPSRSIYDAFNEQGSTLVFKP